MGELGEEAVTVPYPSFLGTGLSRDSSGGTGREAPSSSCEFYVVRGASILRTRKRKSPCAQRTALTNHSRYVPDGTFHKTAIPPTPSVPSRRHYPTFQALRRLRPRQWFSQYPAHSGRPPILTGCLLEFRTISIVEASFHVTNIARRTRPCFVLYVTEAVFIDIWGTGVDEICAGLGRLGSGAEMARKVRKGDHCLWKVLSSDATRMIRQCCFCGGCSFLP